MLVCSQPQTQPWSPDFSASGLRSPSWTRLRVDGQELCNALEDVVWSPNPVQLQLPAATALPATTRRVLAQAWRAEVRGRLVDSSLADTIGKAGQYVMGSDRWDRDDAVRALRLVGDWFAEDPEAAVRGELVRASWAGTLIETFYTDGPREEDWPAIGIRDDGLSPAFGSDWVLHPSVVHR